MYAQLNSFRVFGGRGFPVVGFGAPVQQAAAAAAAGPVHPRPGGADPPHKLLRAADTQELAGLALSAAVLALSAVPPDLIINLRHVSRDIHTSPTAAAAPAAAAAAADVAGPADAEDSNAAELSSDGWSTASDSECVRSCAASGEADVRGRCSDSERETADLMDEAVLDPFASRRMVEALRRGPFAIPVVGFRTLVEEISARFWSGTISLPTDVGHAGSDYHRWLTFHPSALELLQAAAEEYVTHRIVAATNARAPLVRPSPPPAVCVSLIGGPWDAGRDGEAGTARPCFGHIPATLARLPLFVRRSPTLRRRIVMATMATMATMRIRNWKPSEANKRVEMKTFFF
jgi:hypothetical protein